jgi:hypothetical protein
MHQSLCFYTIADVHSTIRMPGVFLNSVRIELMFHGYVGPEKENFV